MKKTLKQISLLLATGVLMLAASCNKNDAKKTELSDNTLSSVTAKTAESEICCEITCGNRSCKAYGSPCECTCTLFNKPKCASSRLDVVAMDERLFDGRPYVTLDYAITNENRALRNALYGLNKPYATTLANKLEAIDTLISNYGYILTTKQALLDYYDIVDVEEQVAPLFTIAELNALSAFIQ